MEELEAQEKEEARMAEKEIWALKRANRLGWKRVAGVDLKLERLSELPASRWTIDCPNDLGGLPVHDGDYRH